MTHFPCEINMNVGILPPSPSLPPPPQQRCWSCELLVPPSPTFQYSGYNRMRSQTHSLAQSMLGTVSTLNSAFSNPIQRTVFVAMETSQDAGLERSILPYPEFQSLLTAIKQQMWE